MRKYQSQNKKKENIPKVINSSCYNIRQMSDFANSIKEVDTLQARMLAYYTFYQQNKVEQNTEDDSNQFLGVAVTDRQPLDCEYVEEQSLFGSTNPNKNIIVDKILDDSHNESIYESHLLNINAKEDVNLSRIFGDIVIGEQIDNHQNPFDIQLHFNDKVFSIEMNKKDHYSLSNFSSFNKQTDNHMDFGELIDKIQQRAGRKLTKEGIEKIIKQIGQSNRMGERQFEESGIEPKKMSRLSDDNLLHELEDRHQYDNRLNFQRNKHKKSNKDCFKDPQVSWMEGQPVKPEVSRKTKAKPHEQKQNRADQRTPKLPPQKSLKLTRKGKQTTITYRDTRQIQQFCITNKIFGRDKDKILRAITSEKPTLILQ